MIAPRRGSIPTAASISFFSDPAAIALYAEGPARQGPGFHALQRMDVRLLAECAHNHRRMLLLGAGSKSIERCHAGFSFPGGVAYAPA